MVPATPGGYAFWFVASAAFIGWLAFVRHDWFLAIIGLSTFATLWGRYRSR